MVGQDSKMAVTRRWQLQGASKTHLLSYLNGKATYLILMSINEGSETESPSLQFTPFVSGYACFGMNRTECKNRHFQFLTEN